VKPQSENDHEAKPLFVPDIYKSRSDIYKSRKIAANPAVGDPYEITPAPREVLILDAMARYKKAEASASFTRTANRLVGGVTLFLLAISAFGIYAELHGYKGVVIPTWAATFSTLTLIFRYYFSAHKKDGN
jgi:hypothetical protein